VQKLNKAAENTRVYDDSTGGPKEERGLKKGPHPDRYQENCQYFFRELGNQLGLGSTWSGSIPEGLQANKIVEQMRKPGGNWGKIRDKGETAFLKAQCLANEGAIVVGGQTDSRNGHLAVVSPVLDEFYGLRSGKRQLPYPYVRDGNEHLYPEKPKPGEKQLRKPGTYGAIQANFAFKQSKEIEWYVWNPSNKLLASVRCVRVTAKKSKGAQSRSSKQNGGGGGSVIAPILGVAGAGAVAAGAAAYLLQHRSCGIKPVLPGFCVPGAQFSDLCPADALQRAQAYCQCRGQAFDLSAYLNTPSGPNASCQ
jgi:hypothetical protein